MRAAITFTALLAAVAGGTAGPIGQERAPGDLVTLDVVVLDRKDHPVLGLQPQDFSVREDGKAVEIKTFAAPPSESTEPPPNRQLVLLLDDSSVPKGGTLVIQGMARAIMSRKHPDDEVVVVRLNNDRDEPYGDLDTALMRIDGYNAGAVPFQNVGTADRALKVIASIARQIGAEERGRTLIVCIGGPRVCNVLEPQRGYPPLWRRWVDAVTSTARANAAVYAVMPVPIGTPMRLTGGLADITGGDGFANASPFEAFVERIWTEARDYYLLGYWPLSDRRELHSIEVRVKQPKGARVFARRQRG